MTVNTFKALVVRESEGGTFTRAVEERNISDLPDGDVLIRVIWSSLNYKDALSATGNHGVTRHFPHTPGIDCAGEVVQSSDEHFKPGDRVLVTSYDLGMNTDGGFAEYVRVPSGWVVQRPAGLTAKEAMIYGTAGFTAGLSVYALNERLSPEAAGEREVLVTGATGGVGSVAVALLAKLGYRVTAVTGKAEAAEYLRGLGAYNICSREDVTAGNDRPLMKPRWAGVIDCVGGEMLTAAIKATAPMGVVTCCGNVASPDLPLNVFPFILRGVTLVGIDSQNCSMERRLKVWERLAGLWKLEGLEDLSHEVTLEGLDDQIDLILKGGQRGRVIVNLG
ncbi:YhdH/YhfP family quinone oxidoreductase [Desulforhopalus vacuolatus]|uniref:YhdH/YhfP family quinone oxidoreductase n=1 Tax=Desulforhopalus vacuolatus TaxID=40414 RepID=UPI00196286D1|nr:YhdH/YhfP family quinone oxidoreductase [Desulforhopalus vacuolatus]MBM9518637.1 YhdH/YhfP family quinone oxidoreductase [Desulforhopalus vacuolatus]